MIVSVALGFLILGSIDPGVRAVYQSPAYSASTSMVQDSQSTEGALSLLRSIPNWDSQFPSLDVPIESPHIPTRTPALLQWQPPKVSRIRLDATDKLITLAHMDTPLLYQASVLYINDPSARSDAHRILTVLALVRLIFDLTSVDQSTYMFATDDAYPEAHMFPWTVGSGGDYQLTGKPSRMMISVYPFPNPLKMFRDFIEQGVPRRGLRREPTRAQQH